MNIWKGPHFQKNYDDFIIINYDKIYDGKFKVTKCTIFADRKTIQITA